MARGSDNSREAHFIAMLGGCSVGAFWGVLGRLSWLSGYILTKSPLGGCPNDPNYAIISASLLGARPLARSEIKGRFMVTEKEKHLSHKGDYCSLHYSWRNHEKGDYPIAICQLEDIPMIKRRIAHLRLWGVYDFVSDEVVFSSAKYSACKRYIKLFCFPLIHSVRQFQILRFDSVSWD